MMKHDALLTLDYTHSWISPIVPERFVWLPLVVSCFQFSWSLRRDTLAQDPYERLPPKPRVTHYYKCQSRTKMRSMLQWLQARETWDGTKKNHKWIFAFGPNRLWEQNLLSVGTAKTLLGGTKNALTRHCTISYTHQTFLKGKPGFMANKSR